MVDGHGRKPHVPSYRALAETGELAYRASVAMAQLDQCRLCGWNCGINRHSEVGPCRTGAEIRLSTSYIHMGEERPLVGTSGSGAIFFTNCDLRCQFCQTYRWNIAGIGTPVTEAQLADIMVSLQDRGAININLVTPTHVLPQILRSLVAAVECGLHIPLIWNSGGYDSLEALELLEGIVDIFLPDMKYSDSGLAMRLSGVKNYAEVNQAAVKRMHDMVGDLVTDELGQARRGVLVRHLVMPDLFENTAGVLKWISENLGNETYVSLMDQYRPAYKALNRRDINRAVTIDEIDRARKLAHSLGLTRLDPSAMVSQIAN